MSITKIITPKIPSPVFVPQWFQVSSTNVTQANFRYVFDTFTTTTGLTTSNSRNRLYPNPNNNYCEYSPSRIFESYLYFEAFPTLTGSSGTNGSYLNYTVAIGEEYGITTTGTTTYSGLSWYTGITFNGTLQYNEIPGWNTDWSKLVMTGNTGHFLTNSRINLGSPFWFDSEQDGSRTFIDDYFTLSFFNDMRQANRPRSFWVNVWQKDFTNVRVYAIKLPTATATTSTWIQHIGVGPQNLMNISTANMFTGVTAGQIVINPDTDAYYTVQLSLNADGNQFAMTGMSKSYFFLIDDNCNKYPKKRFIFQNRKGQAEHLTFSLVSKRQVDAKRDTFGRVLDFNYAVGQRSLSITDIQAQDKLSVTTDWITEVENTKIEEFLTSPEVFLLDDRLSVNPNTLIPYVVNTGSIQFKTHAVDKLINYQFDMQPAHMINTQRAGNQRTIASGGNPHGGGGVPIGVGGSADIT